MAEVSLKALLARYPAIKKKFGSSEGGVFKSMETELKKLSEQGLKFTKAGNISLSSIKKSANPKLVESSIRSILKDTPSDILRSVQESLNATNELNESYMYKSEHGKIEGFTYKPVKNAEAVLIAEANARARVEALKTFNAEGKFVGYEILQKLYEETDKADIEITSSIEDQMLYDELRADLRRFRESLSGEHSITYTNTTKRGNEIIKREKWSYEKTNELFDKVQKKLSDYEEKMKKLRGF